MSSRVVYLCVTGGEIIESTVPLPRLLKAGISGNKNCKWRVTIIETIGTGEMAQQLGALHGSRYHLVA